MPIDENDRQGPRPSSEPTENREEQQEEESPASVNSINPIIYPQLPPSYTENLEQSHQMNLPQDRPTTPSAPPHQNLELPPAAAATGNQEIECCICLEDIVQDDGAIVNPCMHPFHYQCIMEWSKRSNTCPLCKIRFKKVTKIHRMGDRIHSDDIPVEETVQRVPYQQYLPESYVVSRETTSVPNVYRRNQYPPITRYAIAFLTFITFIVYVVFGALYITAATLFFQNVNQDTRFYLYGIVNAGFVIFWIGSGSVDLAIGGFMLLMVYRKRLLYLKIFIGLMLVQSFISASLLAAVATLAAIVSKIPEVLWQFILPSASIGLKFILWSSIAILYIKALYPNTFCPCIRV